MTKREYNYHKRSWVEKADKQTIKTMKEEYDKFNEWSYLTAMNSMKRATITSTIIDEDTWQLNVFASFETELIPGK